MKLGHLRAFAPVCPRCRAAPVEVEKVVRGSDDEVEEGLLACTSPTCLMEFPIVGGIPLLVRDLRKLVQEQVLSIGLREDVSETLLAALGECAGPSSTFDLLRQHLSSYTWAHYGDHDREEPDADAGAPLLGVIGRAVDLARGIPGGRVVDLGCSLGRGSLELAARTEGRADAPLVLGLDLNVSMLRAARAILRDGRVSYARRRTGLVYDERRFAVPTPGAARVDYWCADALALPLAPASTSLLLSVNLIDCLSSPLDHLRAVAEALQPGGVAAFATPFDWSPAATQPESWIGGHSPRGTRGGRSDAILRDLVTGAHVVGVPGLELLGEERALPWKVRLHERSRVEYSVDLVVVRKTG